jgi:hypothetical protein
VFDIFYVGKVLDDWKNIKARFPFAKQAMSATDARKMSLTSMCWVIWEDVLVDESFNFDLEIPEWDRSYIHVFKNGEHFDGICLFPKHVNVSNRETEYRFFFTKKEIELRASTPKPFDIIFISYNEPNAEENWKALVHRFPRAKRVHGVKGIHNAHKAAAELSTTDMFWVVDADAKITDTFDFTFRHIPFFNKIERDILKDTVYVWRSRNPINNLEYGYGGVKLLPKDLTLAMRTDTVDMTTSISKTFNAKEQVSNITAFNTDPFNTWKSAFRECVKLASKAIERQDNTETTERLNVWRTVATGEFGEYAIKGANDALAFVNQGNDISKINDFDYLQELFKQ